jgi:hypothetical protein
MNYGARDQLVGTYCINEAALGRVTVSDALKRLALSARHSRARDARDREGHADVTGNWLASDETRSLRGDEPDTQFDVVTVLFVVEGKGGENVVSNREGVTLTRRRCAVSSAARGTRRSL